MSKRKRFGVSEALTRGITETINVVENNSGVFRHVVLPLARIELDPDNPRKLAITLDDVREGLNKDDDLYSQKNDELEKLKELANTIISSGVINPIVAYKRGEFYRVVAGERRCLASVLAGKQEIEARIFNEKPKGYELKLIQWIENTAREDLTLAERMGNIREILQEYQQQHGEKSVSATLLKNITGLSLPQATYYLAVLNAPDDVSTVIQSGHLRNLDKAAVLAGIDNSEIRRKAIQACLHGCSVKQLRQIITREKDLLKHKKDDALTVKRGRSASRVNMGFTLNTDVVQTLVRSVVSQAEFKKYSDVFSSVNWSQLEQAARAFKKLIEILEQEIVR